MNHTADVLIVGAGPTGLALANALAHHGVSFSLIERKPHLSTHTKATNLMQGIQEKLAIYNLLDPMLVKAGSLERLGMYGYGQNLGPVSYWRNDSPFHSVLLLGQHNIEQGFNQSLTEQGVAVRFDSALVDLKQDQQGVTVTINEDGIERLERYKYVIGADGPRSIVRTFTNLDFTPTKTGVTVRQVDARLTWKRPTSMKQMWLFYYDGGFGVVISLPDGITKIMSFDDSHVIPDRTPTLPEMQTALRQFSGDDSATLEDPIWFSYGELLTGLAPALIDERVILAGDSGNPILPNGGQGLNTGIQDAVNLAWKLTDVLKFGANKSLLKTYEIERLGFRTELEKGQNSSLKYIVHPPKLVQWAVKKFGRYGLKKGGDAMIRFFSQLGVEYLKSPLTVEKVGTKGIRAGQNIQDGDLLEAKTRREVSLFGLLAQPNWKLLYFDKGVGISAEQARSVNALPYPYLDTYLISSSVKTAATLDNLFFDLEAIVHRTYIISQPMFYLVRPDNHVALRTTSLVDVPIYLNNLYPQAATQSAVVL
ncbi:FAD-dependent monooxygenase [Fibrella aquatilis]|uniref:FAD-dependent monooxygenase n=1 Tax=Fibrella aquatilis TaxID=2817059 RepID=A0A939JYA0_9BACT|nr:FAD-dependent monooxygenase [Fibrella aquatilis]MBO0931869.1 FAD-dependent monooxygenase [Fibrella aquatilis]